MAFLYCQNYAYQLIRLLANKNLPNRVRICILTRLIIRNPKNRKMKHLILVFVLTIVGLNLSHAQSALRTKHFNIENGLAIQGYDPIAYFLSNKAIKGSKGFAVSAEGVTYYFSSQKNKELFLKDPKKYEPQYGGWCAYAMGAANEKVEIDPETFKIVDGKLYLFYHTWLNNTLLKWNQDEKRLKSQADKNWSVIYK